MKPSDPTTAAVASGNPSSRKESGTLTSERVVATMTACMNGSTAPPALIVEGITSAFAFDPAKLEASRDAIAEMVADLPDEFMASGGGGWSFLNLCVDRHGRQWTDLHRIPEALCCLAIEVNVGRWILPREVWSALPGGMPYVQFDRTGGVAP